VTLFIVIAVLMAALSLAFLLPPLLRARSDRADVDRARANLGVLKDQLAELEADHARGVVADAQYAEIKAELERRVIDDVGKADVTSAAAATRSRWPAVALAALMPLAAAGLYVKYGDPAAFDRELQAAAAPEDDAHTLSPEQLDGMVASLRKRLEKDPDNAQGWFTLARSLYQMRNFDEAAKAYERLLALVPDDADLLADYADALAMAQGRKFEGKPRELIAKALALDPRQWKALAMAGTDAFNQGDYKAAVARWEALRASLPAEASITQSIEGSIAEARQRAGMPAQGPALAQQAMPNDDMHKSADKNTGKPAAAAGSAPADSKPAIASVGGTVTLSPALRAKAAPTDAVFVFVRSASGGRMPIALTTLQVKDLPAKFTLDDDQSISPNNRLSGHAEVIVGARISKRGSPMPQSGDLEGLSKPVKLGVRDASITIDTVLP
jgi:cytochrome c-type biogenesis protein CcmH